MSSAVLSDEGAIDPSSQSTLALVKAAAGGPRHFKREVDVRHSRLALATYGVLFLAAELSALADVRAQALGLAGLTVLAISRSAAGVGLTHVVGATVAAIAAVRLFTVTVPFGGVSTPTRAVIVGLCSLAVWHVASGATIGPLTKARPESPPAVARGQRWIRILTVLSAIPLSLLAFRLGDVEQLTYTTYLATPIFSIVALAAALAIGALGEELLYRRLLTRTLNTTAEIHSALLIGLVWAVTYVSTGGPAYLALIAVTGVGLAWAYKRTSSIRLVAFTHAVVSILALMVWPALL